MQASAIRGGAALLSLLLSLAWTGALAAEVKLGIVASAQSDPLVSSLKDSPSLKSLQIDVAVLPLSTDLDALEAALKGETDLSAFTLDALTQLKSDNRPQLAPILAQPFQFASSLELFKVEDTPFGEAVLADVNRTGLFPLAFWNRGLSEIVTKHLVQGLEDFKMKGLKVATQSESGKSMLSAIGVPSTILPPNEMYSALRKGAVDASETEPYRSFYGYASPVDPSRPTQGPERLSLIAGFRPLVGVLVASPTFWIGLTEEKRQALAEAADSASQISRKAVLSNEESTPKGGTMGNVTYISLNREQTEHLRSISNAVYGEKVGKTLAERQINLLDKAKATTPTQPGKKRPNWTRSFRSSVCNRSEG
jgi:TRAP-type C4-dicarboxylate transport system substrate-binding protein